MSLHYLSRLLLAACVAITCCDAVRTVQGPVIAQPVTVSLSRFAQQVVVAQPAAPVAAPVVAPVAAPVVAQPVLPEAAAAPGVPGAHLEGMNADTYAFLRASSDRVGKAVANMLGVQNNLDEMKEDLAGEYSRWMQKKTHLVADNDRQSADILRLEKALREQKAQQEEKLRLEQIIVMKQQEEQKILFKHVEDAKKFELTQDGMHKDVLYYETQMKNVSALRLAYVAQTQNRTNGLREDNMKMQNEVFHLNKQVQFIEKILADDLLNSSKLRNDLLVQVDGLQKGVHGLQQEMLAQARLESEILSYRKRIAAQADQTKEQRVKLAQFRTDCERDLKQLDFEVAASKDGMEVVTKQLLACQSLDAQNQQSQGQLNACRAKQRR